MVWAFLCLPKRRVIAILSWSLVTARRNNRSFVVRGDKIGVFKHTNEGKVEYAATIRDLGFKKMKGFEPKHVSLIIDFFLRSLIYKAADAARPRYKDGLDESTGGTLAVRYGY